MKIKNEGRLKISRIMIFQIVLISILVSFFSSACFAAGDATQCKATITAVYLKKISGEWIEIKNAAHEVDLTAEEPLISFINYDRVAPGKYANFKIIFSETFRFAGRDGLNMTKEGGEITLGGTATKASELPGDITSIKVLSPTWNNDFSGMATEHLNLDFEDRNDTIEIYPRRNFLKPFIIKKGSAVNIWMTLSLSRTVYFAFPNMLRKGVPTQKIMYFIPPTEIDDMSITVDATSRFASGDEIAFDL